LDGSGISSWFVAGKEGPAEECPSGKGTVPIRSGSKNAQFGVSTMKPTKAYLTGAIRMNKTEKADADSAIRQKAASVWVETS